MYDYKKEAVAFVEHAFYLLDTYKNDPYLYKHDAICSLSNGHYIRIDKQGRLYVLDKKDKIIAHSFNEAYSQITYVGKLLTVYLEHLQMDDC